MNEDKQVASKIPTSGFTFRLVSQEDTNYSSSETMLGQLTEVMSMDDVQVLYPKERTMLYGINKPGPPSLCETNLVRPEGKSRDKHVVWPRNKAGAPI